MFTVLPSILPYEFGSDPINSGDTVSIQCTVKGDLPLSIYWLMDENIIENDYLGISINKISQRISTLSIDYVKAEHRANYTCVVKNEAGQSSHSWHLAVNGTGISKIL